MQNLFYPDVLTRLPLYAVLGLMTEVCFTGIWDLVNPRFLHSWKHKILEPYTPSAIRRDPRAMGYTFLWMIPCYMGLVLIEPLSMGMHAWPLWLRGFVYLPLFWMGEYATGWLFKKMTGLCPWDYSYSPYSLHGYIRWDFAPFWYGFTVLTDGWVIPKLVFLTPYLRASLAI